MKGEPAMRRQIISRIPAFAALLLFCLVIYLYVDGWFDVSFIARGDTPDNVETVSTDADTSDNSNNGGSHTSAPETNGPSSPGTDPPSTDPPETDNPGADVVEFVTIPDVKSLGDGYSRSYSDWVPNGGWSLAEAKLGKVTPPSWFSSHKKTVYDVSYVSNGGRNPYEVVYTPVSVDAPAVTLYMGYIIVETKKPGTVNIYSSDGSPLGSYAESKIEPAWCRDRSGRPLFTYSDAYYYLDADKKRFTLSDYDPNTGNRGALFDYTSDYGKSREKDRQFVSKSEIIDEYIPVDEPDNAEDTTGNTFYVVPTLYNSFALANGRGEAVGEYDYTVAYEFSDSLAAVVDAEGHLYYITPSGSTAIETSRVYKDVNFNERSVIEFYMEPLSNGPESIGFYFFEHGLVRARVLKLDNSRYKKGRIYVISDEDVVITTSGERFNIPLGYDIISYSSGVFLLSGENGYGYMDYTGTWIVDPDLDGGEPFYEGLAVIKKNGKYALIDTAGNTVIPYGQFSHISNASSGVIAAYDGDWHILYKMKH